MGTHGRGRMAHLLLGSVAEKVARTAPCPVLTMRDDAPCGRTWQGLRILVPTDFSPAADAALGCARRLAAKLRGSIRLLHVVEHPADRRVVRIRTVRSGAGDGARGTSGKARRTDSSRRILVDSRSRVTITSDVVLGPSPAMIAAYAGDNGFDLIVMGTRGRGGFAHAADGQRRGIGHQDGVLPGADGEGRRGLRHSAGRGSGGGGRRRVTLSRRDRRADRISRSGSAPDPG